MRACPCPAEPHMPVMQELQFASCCICETVSPGTCPGDTQVATALRDAPAAPLQALVERHDPPDAAGGLPAFVLWLLKSFVAFESLNNLLQALAAPRNGSSMQSCRCSCMYEHHLALLLQYPEMFLQAPAAPRRSSQRRVATPPCGWRRRRPRSCAASTCASW